VGAGDGAATQHKHADGAGGFRVGDAHEFQIRSAANGHRGNERNTHASADKTKQARKLSTLEDDLRRNAGTITGGDSIFAETVAVAQQQERFFAHLAQRNRAAAGELVFFGKGRKKRLGKKRQGLKLLTAHRYRENRQVENSRAQPVEKHWSDFFDDRNSRFRKSLGKGRDYGRQKVGRDGGDHAHRDVTGD